MVPQPAAELCESDVQHKLRAFLQERPGEYTIVNNEYVSLAPSQPPAGPPGLSTSSSGQLQLLRQPSTPIKALSGAGARSSLALDGLLGGAPTKSAVPAQPKSFPLTDLQVRGHDCTKLAAHAILESCQSYQEYESTHPCAPAGRVAVPAFCPLAV